MLRGCWGRPRAHSTLRAQSGPGPRLWQTLRPLPSGHTHPASQQQHPACISKSPPSKEKCAAEPLPSQNRGARAHHPYLHGDPEARVHPHPLPPCTLAHWGSSRGSKPPQSHRTAKNPQTKSNTGSHRGWHSGWGAPTVLSTPPALPLCFSLQVQETTLLALFPRGPCFLVTVGATHPQESSPLSAKCCQRSPTKSHGLASRLPFNIKLLKFQLNKSNLSISLFTAPGFVSNTRKPSSEIRKHGFQSFFPTVEYFVLTFS